MDQSPDRRFCRDQCGDIVIDGENVIDPFFVIADEKGAGFEDPSVLCPGEIGETVVYPVRVRAEGFQHDAGRSVAGMPVGYMPVLDIDDRVL